jgi:DNA polymerase-1
VEACAALDAMCEIAAIETLLSNFIIPLQGDDLRDKTVGRIHCSLNINTETGRLSARR